MNVEFQTGIVSTNLEQTLSSRRLLLEPLRPADKESFYRLMIDSDIIPGLFPAQELRAFDTCSQLLRDLVAYGARNRPEAARAIVRRRDRMFLGICGFQSVEGTPLRQRSDCYIGIRSDYRRAGYAREAMAILLAFGFLTLRIDSVNAVVRHENYASKGFFKGIGMQPELATETDSSESEPRTYTLTRREYLFNQRKQTDV